MEKKKHVFFRQALALLLCAAMLVPMFPAQAFATENSGAPDVSDSTAAVKPEASSPEESEPTGIPEETEEAPEIGLMATATGENTVYVIAGSDYQGHESDDKEANTGTARGVVTTKILNELASCGIKPDGALFCGDYTRYGRSSNIANNKSDVKRGIDQLKSLTTSTLGVRASDMHWIFAQGNHDAYATTEHGLSKGGANDPASGAYGVYVLNNNDYGWTKDGNMAGDTELIEKERQEMKAYFDAKIKAGYTKPIFIAAHIPLHYSYRTRTYEDARYARMIFNVINDAGAKGLNIIYLFGHNHSAPSDSYIGGGAAYLGRGDTIFIAKTDNVDAKPSKLTLNFTYMNCGYLSYASNVNTDGSTPSMAVFAITGDKVEIKRYCYHGLLALKARGKLASFAESGGTVTETHDTYGVTEAEMNAYLNTRFKSTTLEPVSSTNMGETIQIPIFSTRFYQVNTFKEGQFFAIANYGDGEGQYQVLRTTNNNGGVGVRNVTFKKDSSGRIYFEPFATDDENKAIQWIWEGYAKSENGTVGSLKNRLYSRYLQMTDDGSGFVLGDGSKGLRTTSSKNTEDLKMYWGYDNKTRTAGDFKGYPSGVYAHSDNELTVVANRYYVLRNGKSNGWSAGGSGSPSGGNGPTYIFKRFTDYISGYDKAVAEGPTEYTLVTGQYASWDKLKAEIMSDVVVKVNGTATTGFTVSSTADPTTAGEYIAYVNYNGYTLGTIKIHVTKAQVVSAVVSPDSGEVFQHSGSNTKTGSILTVTYNNGAVVKVPVTVGMLKTSDGQAVSTGTTGSQKNLSIVYEGFTVSGYTLTVRHKNHPGYPNPGSVKVEKEGEGVEFAKTGAANVELSATGMPMVSGIDVIVMVDTSSSMSAGKTEDGITRDKATYNAINELIKTLKADIKAGVLGDTTKIAIADFNGYKTPKNGKTYATKGWGGYYALDEDAWVRDPDNPLNSGLHYDDPAYMNVANSHGARTGTGGVNNLTASAFVDVRDLSDTWANSTRLPLHGGTNYDFAMDAIYQLGYRIKEYNEQNDLGDRELVVIFLSDGCPFQYNYWMSHANNNLWNYWLQGQLNKSALNHLTGLDKTFQHFYNSDGKHWMAEAIKGDPGKTYKVIRKSDEGLEGVIQKLKTSAGGKQYMGDLPGLGAQVHTIALGIVGSDSNIWHSSMEHVLKNISSDPETNYHNVNNAAQLKTTFQQIATTVVQAATQSYFLDTMGENYGLYMSDKILKSDGTTVKMDDGETDLVPAIEVRDYTVTGILRNTEPEKVLERITFGGDYRNVADGTSMTVYQDLLNEDGTYTRKTISMKMGGLLKGKYVYYNTSKTKSQTVTYYGKTIILEPETFFYITTTLVRQKEFALNYYVYLEDALDNNGDNIAVDAGTYNTNKSAKLYYKNYLGKDCTKNTTSPKMTWKDAKVSYGFYLVDPSGKIITDEATGETVTNDNTNFRDKRITLVGKTLYKTFDLNTTATVSSLDPKVLASIPEGYALYLPNGVTYEIDVWSGKGGAWNFTGEASASADRTSYVTGYNKSSRNNASKLTDFNDIDDGDLDYYLNDTTVWFALVKLPEPGMPVNKIVDATSDPNKFILTLDAYATATELDGVALDEKLVLKEVLSDYVQLYADATVKYKVFTQDYLGGGKWTEELVPFTAATVTTSPKSGRVETIEVTGFDYGANFVMEAYHTDPHNSSNTTFRGRKLVVKVWIETRDGFWGGNNVPTNKSSTAMYAGSKLVKPFPMPEINVPIDVVVKAEDKTIYYDGKIDSDNDGKEGDELITKVTIGGKEVTVNDDGTFTPTDDWMDDFANASWGNGSTKPNSDLDNQNPGDYTYTVVVTPTSDGTTNQSENPSNIAGNVDGGEVEDTHSSATPAEDSDIGHVYILVPTLTFKDSVTAYDTPVNGYDFAKKDYVSTEWLDSVTGNMAGTNGIPAADGTAPTLTLTYRPDASAVKDGKFVKDTQVNVTVKNGTEDITSVSKFKWEKNGCNHGVADITTPHAGSSDHYEFWVHVVTINPDTVVIDYGLPVRIDILSNDHLASNINVDGIIKGNTNSGTFDSVVYGDFGKLELITDNTEHKNKVVYTPGSYDAQTRTFTPGIMEMNTKDVFTYKVHDSYDTEHYATVTVIPATTIYYEDTFVTTTTFTRTDTSKRDWNAVGNWGTVNNTEQNGFQGEHRPGDTVFDTVYGYDTAYESCSMYSLGNARKITVTPKCYGTAEFTFWGTGFDVISLSSSNTGFITVQVKQLKDGQGTAVTGGTTINKAVDTYYGYTYVENTQTGKMEWRPATAGDAVIYQVPVMKVENLEYGQYQVTITASYSNYFDHNAPDADSGSYDFYLDAIRIYDPAKEDTSLEEIYRGDGEGSVSYQELRNLLIKADSFNTLGDSTVKGAIFVDGIAFLDESSDGHDGPNHADVSDKIASKPAAIKDYANYGPNNEVYLANGQGVAFELGGKTETVNRVYLSLKAPMSGKAGKVTVYGIDPQTKNQTPVTLLTDKSIESATDLYFDITPLMGKTVVIMNTGDGMISVTNLKFAYGTNLLNSGSDLGYITMSRESGHAVLELLNGFTEDEVETDVIPEGTTPVDPEIPGTEATEPETTEPGATEPEATQPEATEPETTEPEATEPEATEPEATEPEATEPEATEPEVTEPDGDAPDTFNPEKMEVTLSNTSVKVGSQVMVTVTTGEDVAYLTVNGAKVTFFTQEGGQRIWRVRLTAKETGGMSIRVVAYNSTGAASQTVLKILEVTDSYTSIGNWLEDLIIRLVSNLTK